MTTTGTLDLRRAANARCGFEGANGLELRPTRARSQPYRPTEAV
jgi:hypothetical protein